MRHWFNLIKWIRQKSLILKRKKTRMDSTGKFNELGQKRTEQHNVIHCV